MLITSLEVEPRTGGVRIQLDGHPFGTVAAEDVQLLGLAVEAAVSERQAEHLARRAEVFSARQVALGLLGRRALPATEVLRRLLRRGHARPAAEEAVEALRNQGVVDDVEFARHYARTRAGRQRFGPRRLIADLRRLGVSEPEAARAVAETLEAEGIEAGALLREAAFAKARSLRDLAPEAQRRRLRAYLVRRGFGGAEVAAVVKEALGR